MTASRAGAQSVQYRSDAGVEYRSLSDTSAIVVVRQSLSGDSAPVGTADSPALALADLRRRMESPIRVPTLALCGSDDLREELMTHQSQYFTGEYSYCLYT